MSKPKQKAGAEYRKTIADGHELLCAICGALILEHPTVDHIIPKSLGGSDRAENFQPAHKACNMLKGSFIITGLAELIHDLHCPKESHATQVPQEHNSAETREASKWLRVVRRFGHS